ncbi:MAG: hypothetical protein HYV90_05600 [Candidatus Woesebacteria bacterium]|nr:MAG: hypothetical protein HYV90_05600 [Candidatus Woesebacteria bacterium]
MDKNKNTVDFLLVIIATIVVGGIVLAIVYYAGPAILVGIQSWFKQATFPEIGMLFIALFLIVLVSGFFRNLRR